MEKVDGECAPYAIVQHYGAIENKLFLNVNLSIGERDGNLSCSLSFFFVFNFRNFMR